MTEAEFHYQIGQHVVDKLKDITVNGLERRMDLKRRHKRKWIGYHCNKCGWDEGWMLESNMNKSGCSCCRGFSTVFGINDIYTLFPDKRQYFANIEDAKTHTKGSHDVIEFICPNCHTTKWMEIHEFMQYGLGCAMCSDGISIPEKFVYALLEQLNLRFIKQLSKKTFKWCNGYLYDFYVIDYKMIIEVNGMQHYENKFYQTCEEVKLNDSEKIKLAIQHKDDVKYFVVIDAAKSDKEYLISSIINNGILDVFGVSKEDVDFDKCYQYCLSSRMMDVCNAYKQNVNIKELAELFHTNPSVIRNYLKRGTDAGFIHYDPKQIMKEVYERQKKNPIKAKQVIITDPNGNEYEFASNTEAARKSLDVFGTSLCQSDLSQCCHGKIKQTKGFTSRFKE